MIHYARSDTHFLLYIYDNLRNALLARAQTHPPSATFPSTTEPPPGRDLTHAYVFEVLRRSEETALRVYEKETYDSEGFGPGGWNAIAKKWNKPLLTKAAGSEGGVQREVYKAVHAWRDRVAREDDESTRCKQSLTVSPGTH
jgi:exosome complex exonuclease RRP6